MSARSFPFVVAALVFAVTVASVGCEDDVAVDDGIPTDEEFLDATAGTFSLYTAGVSANLLRYRNHEFFDTMPSPARRLRALVPPAIASAISVTPSVTSSFDSTRGEWSVEASATSGDSLTFTYSARVSYIDTTGARTREFVAGATEFGTFSESVELGFRTGDLDDPGTDAYDVFVDIDFFADVRIGATTTGVRDTFYVDVHGRIDRTAQVDSVTRDYDFTGRIVGPVGPGAQSGSRCVYTRQQLRPDGSVVTTAAEWNGFRANLSVGSSPGGSLAWFDPDQSIQGTNRIVFRQSGVGITCP